MSNGVLKIHTYTSAPELYPVDVSKVWGSFVVTWKHETSCDILKHSNLYEDERCNKWC